MPKRANPYTEDFIQQSKMHIGLKQFNNNEVRLQKVYEKTLHLLFLGAKKPHEDITSTEVSPISKKDRMKQLYIGKDGSLVHSENLAIKRNVTPQNCLCNGLKSDFCAYCEIALCMLCQHLCGVCQLNFCSKCSLMGSEGGEVCVSCFS